MNADPSRKLFAPNIGPGGRVMRIAGGLALCILAWVLYHQAQPLWTVIAAAAGGAFMLFEGLRGWCALRACNIRTPL